MKRRALLAALAGAAASARTARAQARAVPVIGFLSARAPQESAPLKAAFLDALKRSGFVEGETVRIEYRWAEGDYQRLPALAAELVALRVSALCAVGGTVSAVAAKAATTAIPITFVVGDDPVRTGLVERLNRPGGNVTGVNLISNELGPKRAALLCELLPDVKTIGLLLNPSNGESETHRAAIGAALAALDRQLLVLPARQEADFATVFGALAGGRVGALMVETDPFFNSRLLRLVALCAQYRLPAIYHLREFPAAGGLMSYGTSLAQAYAEVGTLTGEILKGAKPAELPVMRSTRFELVINMKTARTLGITVPAALFARADEVIE
jgi:putative tryptophan/tyrosine transport system substrate-binding protein